MDLPEVKILTRYNVPTKYDSAPYGTLCIVYLSTDNQLEKIDEKLFIQVSQDEQHPHWLSTAHILEQIFFKSFKKQAFLKEILDLFKTIEQDRNVTLHVSESD